MEQGAAWSRHAFVLTDIEASTKRWEVDTESMSADLAHHDEVLQSEFAAAGGSLVNPTGDGFLFEFPDAERAARAAVRAQEALAGSRWPHHPMAVRMAVDAGHAEARGDDFFGPTLNRCARLMTAAAGGQILATRDVAAEIASDTDLADRLHHHGTCRLRDLGDPVEVWEILHRGQPGPTRPAALDESSHNLPFVTSGFVGRRDDLEELERLLEHRPLVTLTGSGGVGKTRLGLQLAARQVDRFPDGTWYVQLESVESDAQVTERLMSVLGIHPIAGVDELDRLHETLLARRTLVLLDCCEHVRDGACRLVEAIASKDLRIVATSRSPLGVPGELVWRVRSLRTDPGPAEGAEATPEALELFSQRVMERDPGVDLADERNTDAAARIVQRLDGIPLAIELAAARLGALDVVDLERKLGEGLSLTDTSTSRSPRHRTIEATIEWSYRLLSDPARRLMRRLTVFASPPDLAAVEAVCVDERADDTADGEPGLHDVVDALDELIDASLVTVSADAGGRRHFDMLDSVGAFATDRWDAEDHANILERHAEWAAALARTCGPLVHLDAGSLEMLCAVDDDLSRAIAWMFDHRQDRGVAMAANLAVYWVVTAQAKEGHRWLDAALEHAGEVSVSEQAKLLEGAGIAAALDVDYERSDQMLARASELFESTQRDRRAAYPKFWRARSVIVRYFQGIGTRDQLEGARVMLADALGALRAHDDLLGQVLALPYEGWARMLVGAEGAQEPLYEALALIDQPGFERVAAYANAHLAHIVLVVDDDPLQAAGLLSGAVETLRGAGDRQNLLICLLLLAAVELRLERHDQAWTAAVEAARISSESASEEWVSTVLAIGWAASAHRDAVLACVLAGHLDHAMPTWRTLLEHTGLAPALPALDAVVGEVDELVCRTAATTGRHQSTEDLIARLARGGVRR